MKNLIKIWKKKIEQFIEINDKGDVHDSNLWEALKAVVRGEIIAFEIAQRKKVRMRMTEIEITLTRLESLHKNSPNNVLLKEIMALKYEYNSLLSSSVLKLLCKVKQRYYELGDKSHNLLARQLRQHEAANAIYQIKNKKGKIITNPKEINQNFAEFYAEVYTSIGKSDQKNIDSFIEGLHLPKLSEKALKALDAEINIEEVENAIKEFPNNKAPGPDGFSIEFYKRFSKVILPLLVRMYRHSQEAGRFPASMYDANIALIPKPGRDRLLVSSYRPISLLPTETKIIGKIIANRLKKHICDIIHPDQTGFMPSRHMYFNLRRLCNVLYSNHKEEAAVISLDAQRAFDQVEWGYMMSVLKKFGFGHVFREWIKTIYFCPKASVVTNHNVSAPFSIYRGTRQGCPLSPFLFAVAIEPLAAYIRQQADIQPITIGGLPQHISLYADDIILFIKNPSKSIPHLLSAITKFGNISGFTVNWGKSELMNIMPNTCQQYIRSTPFKIAEHSFTYLGVIITRKPQDLLRANWQKKIDQLKNNIDYWRTLPISMVGKINAVKMVSLPRFLHLFQSIPSCIPQSYFKQLDKIIFQFLWNYKTARIKKQHFF